MRAISAAILLVISGQVATEEALQPLFEFTSPEAVKALQAVNDGVMGGVSDGRFRITEEGTLEFFGTLSLENNGGFASVRTRPMDLDIKAGDTLVVRLKGDGREYLLNVYTKSRRMAFSYRAPLPTTKDEWREVEIPLADLIPTAFGRRVQGMGPVEPSQISGLGFMLSDNKPGKFTMQVEWVKVLRAARIRPSSKSTRRIHVTFREIFDSGSGSDTAAAVPIAVQVSISSLATSCLSPRESATLMQTCSCCAAIAIYPRATESIS